MDPEIKIDVATRFIEKESDPEHNRWVFAYTIVIENLSDAPAQLLNRHWHVTDAGGRVQEVQGPGVVGKQPRLEPGESFRYTSAAVLETPVGSMRGDYQMRADDGVEFDAEIPAFRLAMPNVLH